MSLIRRTGSNLSWVVLSDLLTKGATVFVTVYLARVLGVAEFGLFSLGVAIVTSIWPAVDLGVNGYGTREVARDNARAQSLASSLNSMRLAAACLVILVTAAGMEIAGVSEQKKWVINAAMIYLAAFAICPDWVARGLERMSFLFVINAVTTVCFIAGIVFFVASPEDTLAASLARSLAFAFGSIAGIAILYYRGRIGFRLAIEWRQWVATVRKSFYFCINRFVENFSRYLSFYLVALILSESALGLIAAPHRLYVLALGVLAAFSTAIYPIMADLHANQTAKFTDYQRQLTRLVLFLFVPVATVGWVTSEEIVRVVFGQEYLGASLVLSLMFAALPIVAVKTIYIFALLCGNHENIAFKVTLAGATIQLILGIITIPQYGIAGAAGSMAASELLALAGVVWICRVRFASFGPFDWFLGKVFVISLIAAAGAHVLRQNVFLTIILAGIAYLLLAITVRVIPASILSGMAKLFR